jgi:O-antigen/teichoic acid export membrane protein
MIAGRISFQTDSMVIGSFLPLAQITFFALPARLCEHAKSTLRSITTVLTPYISQLEGGGEFGKIRQIYIDATRYVLWLVLPVQVGFWLLGGYFFTLWIGPEHAKHCQPVLMMLATPLALALSQSIAGRILYGIGELKFFSRLVLLEATANLLLSIALVHSFGILGVAVGTALPNLLMNIALILHVCDKLKLPLGAYMRQSLLAPWMAAIPCGILWAVIIAYAPIHNWFHFFFVGAAGILVFAIVALLYEFGLSRFRSFLISSFTSTASPSKLRQEDSIASEV